VFCIDDVLDLEDMPTLANDLGQKRLVQANMTTLENAGKQPIVQTPAQPVNPAEPIPPKKPGNGKGKQPAQIAA